MFEGGRLRRLFISAVVGAGADAEPGFSPAEVAALTAGAVCVPFSTGTVVGAGILHPGDEGVALVGILRFLLINS